MLYENLNALISKSSSSREYFLSLPLEIQLELHNQYKYIHSAAELRLRAGILYNYIRSVEISREIC